MKPDLYYLESDGQVFPVKKGRQWTFPLKAAIPCPFDAVFVMPIAGQRVIFAKPKLAKHPSHWFHKDEIVGREDIATVVFAHPPLGMVGLTEAEARLRHGDASIKTYRARFRPMLHALADSPQRSLFKLVCAGEEERVVGIHLLGEGADEMLQGFAVALKKGITKRDLDDTMAIHPTSAEEVVLMR